MAGEAEDAHVSGGPGGPAANLEPDAWWAGCQNAVGSATLCFFGFMRSGELTTPSGLQFDEGAHLCFQDVSTDSLENATLIRVRLK